MVVSLEAEIRRIQTSITNIRKRRDEINKFYKQNYGKQVFKQVKGVQLTKHVLELLNRKTVWGGRLKGDNAWKENAMAKLFQKGVKQSSPSKTKPQGELKVVITFDGNSDRGKNCPYENIYALMLKPGVKYVQYTDKNKKRYGLLSSKSYAGAEKAKVNGKNVITNIKEEITRKTWRIPPRNPELSYEQIQRCYDKALKESNKTPNLANVRARYNRMKKTKKVKRVESKQYILETIYDYENKLNNLHEAIERVKRENIQIERTIMASVRNEYNKEYIKQFKDINQLNELLYIDAVTDDMTNKRIALNKTPMQTVPAQYKRYVKYNPDAVLEHQMKTLVDNDGNFITNLSVFVDDLEELEDGRYQYDPENEKIDFESLVYAYFGIGVSYKMLGGGDDSIITSVEGAEYKVDSAGYGKDRKITQESTPPNPDVRYVSILYSKTIQEEAKSRGGFNISKNKYMQNFIDKFVKYVREEYLNNIRSMVGINGKYLPTKDRENTPFMRTGKMLDNLRINLFDGGKFIGSYKGL